MSNATFNPDGRIYLLFTPSSNRNIHRYLIDLGLSQQINELLEGSLAAAPVEQQAKLRQDPELLQKARTCIIDAILDGRPENNIPKTYVINTDQYEKDVNGGLLAQGYIAIQGLQKLPNGKYRFALSVNLAAIFPDEPAFKFTALDGSVYQRHANGFVDLDSEYLEFNGMLEVTERYLKDINEGLRKGTITRDESAGGRLILARKDQLGDNQRGFSLNSFLFNKAMTSTAGDFLSGMFISVAPPTATQNELYRRINYISISFMDIGSPVASGAAVLSVAEQVAFLNTYGVEVPAHRKQKAKSEEKSEEKPEEKPTGATLTTETTEKPNLIPFNLA